MRENIYYYLFTRCRRLLWNKPRALFLLPVIRRVWKHTLIGYVNLYQTYDAIAQIEKANVPGAIVEMGVWRGGCGAFMAWCAKKYTTQRTVWLFDSFEGLSPFSDEDSEKAAKKQRKGGKVFAAPQKDAEEIVLKLNVRERVKIVKGWFKDTVPETKQHIGKIALLRLDADIYEPTKYCLNELYDLVSPGGIIIIDDYGAWKGCNRAVYEFFAERGLDRPIYHYPYRGRAYFIK